jgi:DNA ligase 1
MKYSELVEIYQKLDSTTKRLDKTYYISEFLKKVSVEELEIVILLLQGIIYPKWDDKKIGVASRLVLKALNIATGIESEKIEQKWKEEGDLGIVAEKLTSKKKQATLFSQDLTVAKVFKNVRNLSELEGAGTVDKKIKLIAELLTSAKPTEARYIIRIVLEDMRVGVGEGSIRDALVWAFFPAVARVFYKCTKCEKFVPATENCLNCQAKLDLKQKTWEEKNALTIETQKTY